MLLLESKARRFGVWLLCCCASAACEEKARAPMGDSATADASSSGDPSESLGPPPDLASGTAVTGDVPVPVACGQAARGYCGQPGDSLGNVNELPTISGCEVYRGSIFLNDAETSADLWPISALRVVEEEVGLVDWCDLETLEGLDCLEEIGGLKIISPPQLRDLSALRNASLNGELFVGGTNELASLDGLQGFAAATRVELTGNTDLRDLEGLSGLERVEIAVVLNQNPLLTDLDGLRNLVDFDGGLRVSSSGKLRSLDGLEQITTLSALRVYENPILESLDGLAGLEHVTGDVEFRDNPMLSTEEIDELLAHVVVDGEVIVE